jgi:two-component system OmpR family sensor kinase
MTVVSGLSTNEVDRTMHRLVLLEWIIGASAILIAFAATSWGVQFSLRRLRSVTNTAQEVAAELSPSGTGLERRVEVHEPETEVGQLATSMNTLLAAVETQFAARVASEERMRQFLADASHELRTPLTSIRGYAELSRMQGASVRTEADNLARIESEGMRMSRLVDDLLTLARTDQGGAPEREPVDVAEIVADAVDGVRAAHPERRIELTAEHELVVLGDRDQLVRVVRNLATNAAVHTRPDGPIRVSASGENGSVVLRVSDSGPGLPPDQAAHVFERFWRADKARSRALGGSGLGLAIVAALVHSHGGDVRFDSSVEGGSTVTVRLPRAAQ